MLIEILAIYGELLSYSMGIFGRIYKERAPLRTFRAGIILTVIRT